MPGRDEEPIFKAEQAPPTVWDQVVAALRPRRATTHAPQKAARPQGARNIMIALGRSLAGAFGGVLLTLGVLGVGMSLLMTVTLVVTRVQGLETGIRWPVVPISLVIFAVVGACGYLMLRAVGMFAGRHRPPRSR